MTARRSPGSSAQVELSAAQLGTPLGLLRAIRSAAASRWTIAMVLEFLPAGMPFALRWREPNEAITVVQHGRPAAHPDHARARRRRARGLAERPGVRRMPGRCAGGAARAQLMFHRQRRFATFLPESEVHITLDRDETEVPRASLLKVNWAGPPREGAHGRLPVDFSAAEGEAFVSSPPSSSVRSARR